MDTRSEKHLATLLPEVQANFRAFVTEAQALAASKGYEYKVICGTRDWDEQARLYAQGRTTPGKIVTKAPPGSSFHNFGLAIDCGVFRGGKYLDEAEPITAAKFHRLVAPLAKARNIRWGGDFKSIVDMPHFEFNTPVGLAELRSRRKRGAALLG
jgi:peptidoglycan L-alanyl-D-glutamate endopeptidase CwlK